MIGARYFSYDGQHCSGYRLQIADFDANGVEENNAVTLKLSTAKAPALPRLYHCGVTFDTPPEFEFSVIVANNEDGSAGSPLTANEKSQILSWLIGGNKFKPFVFYNDTDGDSERNDGISSFTYYCVFTDARSIIINGSCYGFTLKAEFDSPYARGQIQKVTLQDVHNTTQQVFNNPSDIDGYVYPTVKFYGGGILSIYNLTDDQTREREFRFDARTIDHNYLITIDNETKIISCSGGSYPLLDKFISRKWLRLRKGDNNLEINYPSSPVTIEYPRYAMIGY